MYPASSLNVALPGFMEIFNTDLRSVQWLLTGFTLAMGVIAPVSGYASERFGSKRIFIFCIAGIIVSSLLCALSWNIYALILFRVAQGLFSGLIQPVSLAMIYNIVPSEKQPFAISIWSFSTVLSTSIAPSLSGYLQGFNWPMLFLSTVPLAIGVLLAGIRFLPSEIANTNKSLDKTGLLLAAAGSLSLLILFGNLSRWNWSMPIFWICLVIGIGCSIGFVRHELRVKSPLLELRLFRSSLFSSSLIFSLILYIGLFTGVYFMPLYLQDIKGLTPFHTGLVFLPAAFCLTCATFLAGRLYHRAGPAWLVFAGSAILLVSTLYFSTIHPGTSLVAIIVWLAIRNIGTGLAINPATNAGMSAVPVGYSGHASALISWLRQIAAAMILGLFTSLFDTRFTSHQTRLGLQDGVQPGTPAYIDAYTLSVNEIFLIASVSIAITLPICLLLRRSGQDHQSNINL
ncbi:DHA2 family efflux MFS transporter permease subunit [Paenibacillus sp. MAHUQ-46]|uniref:DHA2 family efflux MFS transporter permease subunit n=2 Tax=Paenibacillus TaxID=44249 RepID=A0A934IUW6_9BACL|nr:DHA2 family efflux MFS transporter permease subunit [Paenibacillus roseus]